MKAFMLCRMSGGQPDIDTEATPYYGYVLCDQIANFGAYLFSGTGQQLLALDALPQVLGIVAVTENDEVRWGELDGAAEDAVRDKLNTFLANHDKPQIPEDWTYRQIVKKIYGYFNSHFDMSSFDVAGP